jgi:hypothetical protein
MFALIPGFAAAVNILDDPRLYDLRNADMVRLMAIGWCAGIFVSGLLLLMNSKIANRALAASDLEQSRRQSSTT